MATQLLAKFESKPNYTVRRTQVKKKKVSSVFSLSPQSLFLLETQPQKYAVCVYCLRLFFTITFI